MSASIYSLSLHFLSVIYIYIYIQHWSQLKLTLLLIIKIHAKTTWCIEYIINSKSTINGKCYLNLIDFFFFLLYIYNKHKPTTQPNKLIIFNIKSPIYFNSSIFLLLYSPFYYNIICNAYMLYTKNVEPATINLNNSELLAYYYLFMSYSLPLPILRKRSNILIYSLFFYYSLWDNCFIY